MTLSTTAQNQKKKSLAPSDCIVPHPGKDGISSLSWSPTSNILVSSNWDKSVSCWSVQQEQKIGGPVVQAKPEAQVWHDGAVLDACFSTDGSTVFSGGCDKAVRMWQLGQSQQAVQIGIHDAPVKSVGFLEQTNRVVSGSWDKMVKLWDARSPNPTAMLEMPERVYSLDVRGKLMVVATAGQHILEFDVSGQLPRELSRKKSLVDFQTRCVSVFPDASGYAVGTMGGRVAIRFLPETEEKKTFTFVCHRHGQKKEREAYAINTIAFHGQYGTMATVGSDGVVGFWDKDNKQVLKQFDAIERPIPSAAFNKRGDMFAYASSYDWSKGKEQAQQVNEIFIHSVSDKDIKPRKKSK